MLTDRQGEARTSELGRAQVSQLLSCGHPNSSRTCSLSPAFLASVHTRLLPSRVTGAFPRPRPALAPPAPQPHPSMALTLVFPGLDWHGPYFCRGGLFLNRAGDPLINLRAQWGCGKSVCPREVHTTVTPVLQAAAPASASPRVQDSDPRRLASQSLFVPASLSSACPGAVLGVSLTTLLQPLGVCQRSSQTGNTTFSASPSALPP